MFSKKIVLILLIQLFFIAVSEVHSAPAPNANIFSKALNSVVNAYNRLKDGVKEYFWPDIKDGSKSPKGSISCFAVARFFDKSFDIFFNDKTEKKSVKFYYSSLKHREFIPLVISNDSVSLDHIDFDAYRDTVLISHGYQSHGKMDWVINMTDAFLQYGDYNVIVVDWKDGSNTWNYIGAATSTRVVGDEVAELFHHIYTEVLKLGVDVSLLGKIHFLGHSLGAHIVARAANKIKEHQVNANRAPWIVNRITGMDPAQPCFISAKEHQRLDPKDAEFVDVIHTNARYWLLMGLGLREQIGHIDFYPNGGQMQPGCPIYDESIWSYLLIPKKVMKAAVCSHGRSYLFFTHSILESVRGNKCSFVSHRWNRKYEGMNLDQMMSKSCPNDDCPVLGIHSINSFPAKNGIYFTPTGRHSPYCTVTENDKTTIEDQLKHDASLEKMVDRLGK